MSHMTNHAIPGPDDITRVTLDNGITVLARENFTSPAVVMDGMLQGGGLLEPREKAGLAAFHGAMLMRGTQRHTFDQLFEEIESNGASLSVSASRHTYSFGSKSLAEDLPLMLSLTSEILREPAFPEEHIEKVRGQIMTGLAMRAHNTRQMASLAFFEMAYPPEHPYSWSVSGYPETVQAITREDIIGFQHNLGPRGAIIIVVGAVKAQDAVEMVRAALGDWRNPDQPPTPQVDDAPPLADVRRKVVAIPGKTQTDIVLGTPGPRRCDEDYTAARVANSILGVFGLMGRLGDNIREEKGLAYYSYSRLTGGLGPGPWQVIAGVAPENVEQTVESIRQEIRHLVEELVTDEELSENKSFFKGQLVLGLETNEGIAGAISTMEKHSLGLDYLRNYGAMIDALTVEELQAAARRYLNPDAYALGVAGP